MRRLQGEYATLLDGTNVDVFDDVDGELVKCEIVLSEPTIDSKIKLYVRALEEDKNIYEDNKFSCKYYDIIVAEI